MSYDALLVDALGAALRPRETPPLDEWMDRHYMLERGGVPVPWETDKTPYIRDIARDLSVDSAVEEVVVMKPSQTGLSELLIGLHLYMACVAPCDMLMIQPDLDAAARFKQIRIDKVLKNSPVPRAVFREKKSRDAGNTKHELLYDGGSWVLVGSNSPAGLSSTPATIISFDEVDRSAASAGVGARAEGDQYLLALARTTTFRDTYPRRKLIQISSPGETSTSKIEPAYLASDMRRFHVLCSECGARIVFQMRRLWWPRGGDPRTARYRCQACDRLLDERTKPQMLRSGIWIPQHPDRSVHGYKLTGCDSPFTRWGEMAAYREKVKGNPNQLRVFVNTVEGETYDTLAEAKVDVESLKLLAWPVERDESGHFTVPAGVGVITGGADTQPNRLELQLIGWGRRDESWILDHLVLPGDASARAVWDDLDEVMRTTWVNAHGKTMPMSAACVDTAGANTIPAYTFVRGKGHRRIWGTVGRSGQGKRPWPRRPRQSNIGKIDLYTIGIDGLKAQLYARLKASIEQVQQHGVRGGPGFIHIAAHLCEDIVGPDGARRTNEFLEQLVAEVPKTKLTKAGPVVEWDLPAHTRNEALDCNVLAQAASIGWRALGKRIEAYVERANPPGSNPPATNFVPRSESPAWDKNDQTPIPDRLASLPPSAVPKHTAAHRKRTRPRREIAE